MPILRTRSLRAHRPLILGRGERRGHRSRASAGQNHVERGLTCVRGAAPGFGDRRMRKLEACLDDRRRGVQQRPLGVNPGAMTATSSAGRPRPGAGQRRTTPRSSTAPAPGTRSSPDQPDAGRAGAGPPRHRRGRAENERIGALVRQRCRDLGWAPRGRTPRSQRLTAPGRGRNALFRHPGAMPRESWTAEVRPHRLRTQRSVMDGHKSHRRYATAWTSPQGSWVSRAYFHRGQAGYQRRPPPSSPRPGRWGRRGFDRLAGPERQHDRDGHKSTPCGWSRSDRCRNGAVAGLLLNEKQNAPESRHRGAAPSSAAM